MGIDRIGKSAGVGPAAPSDLAGSAPASSVGQPFSVGAAAPAAAASAVGSPALEQLRAGAIDLAQYVELKVAEATSHLTLPRVQLEAIQQALRDRLSTDPTLVDLVRVAGQVAGGGSPASGV